MTTLGELKNFNQDICGINALELAKLAQTICINNEDKIDKMEGIRHLIDY